MPTNSYAIRFGQLRICAHLQVGSRFELEYIICLAFTLLEKETFFFFSVESNEAASQNRSMIVTHKRTHSESKGQTSSAWLFVFLFIIVCFAWAEDYRKFQCAQHGESHIRRRIYIKRRKKKQNGLTRVWPLNSLLAHVYDVLNSKPAANTKIGNFSLSTHTFYTRKDEFRKDLIEKNGWYLFAKRWTKKQKTENNR